jgi:predicted RND superfamily exporter protein
VTDSTRSRAHPAVRHTAVAAVVLVVLALLGFGVSRVRVDTGIGSFVPRGDASYGALERRDVDFGADPVVVLLRGTSQDGLLADADQLTRLVGLEGALSRLPDVAVVYGPGTVLNQTAGAIRDVLVQMAGARDALQNTVRAGSRAQGKTRAEVEADVRRALAGFDARYGSLVATAMPMGLPSLRNRKFVASVLFDADGNPRPEWRFLAPTAKSATLLVRPRAGLDQAGTERLVERVRRTVRAAGLQTAPPVVTGLPVLSSAVARRAGHEAPRLGALALAGVGLVLFLVPWSRRRRDRLRPLLAVALGTVSTLAVFGLLGRPLSLGVVAFLPIVLGIGSDFPIYLSQPARRRPVLTAAAGAILAFASLGLSQLPFVREFGLALALAVAATVGWALVLRVRWTEVEPVAFGPAVVPGTTAPRSSSALLKAAVVAAVLAAVAGWVLLPGNRIESRPDQLASGLPELTDVAKAESTLGFSGELSIVVRGPQVLTPDLLRWSTQAESAIVSRHGDELRPLLTMSRLLQFLGDDPNAEQVSAGASLLPPYLLDAVVSGGDKVTSSTYGVALDDVAAQRRLIDDIRRELPAPPPGYQVDVVGLPVVAASGLTAMSMSRYLIGLGGLVAAVLVVLVGLRSRRVAVMVAASALLSAGWVYLALRLATGVLNPLTLAAGALITVTACEFTVMLHGSGQTRWLRRSVATSAAAGTVGYLCLALSDLAVLRSFGIVLAAGVVSSYAAARLVVALAGSRPPAAATSAPATAASGENRASRAFTDEEMLSCR